MRKLLILVLLLQTACVWAQSTPVPAIEYKESRQQLTGLIFKYLGRHKGLFDDAMYADSIRKTNKYFSVLLNIDKDGFLRDDIIVTGYNDNTILSVVADAVRQTSGKWINHSGMDQWAMLPIYYVYTDDSYPAQKLPLISSGLYNDKTKNNITSLEHLIIELYPAVR